MTSPTQTQTQQPVGRALKLGPFTDGLHNSSGSGEFIKDSELFELTNLEVDIDGSLVNRPQIDDFTLTGVPSPNELSFIGTYLPSDGRRFIVANIPATTRVILIDASTGMAEATVATGVTSVCCIQYANKLYVVATVASGSNGGFFDAPTSSSISYTTVASMPRGEAVAQYKERIWIACGVRSLTNTSRFFYSNIADPSTWTGTDYIDVVPGNGQKLVSLMRLGADLILFKEHSTHKFSYTTDPRKAELVELDSWIGCPDINCIVSYNNNVMYVLHDNSVYELFQYSYNRISTLVNMDQVTDLTMYAKDQYGLTLHRDRLFVRYYSRLYVYSLKVKKWSSWETTKKFSKVVVIPSATLGLDTAYAHSASSTNAGKAYRFQDNRKTLRINDADTTNENFQGKITTKTMEFDVPQSYKVMFWYGIALATSGNFSATYTVPNASANMTWAEAQALYGSWGGAAAANAVWSTNANVTATKVITPALGAYARKFIKLPKKLRFRQIKFSFVFDIVTNGGIADATLRVYDLTIFIKQKQTVVKETT